MSKARTYSIEVTAHAERSLKKLNKDKELLGRLDKRIRSLAKDPRPAACKKLKSGRYANLYRICEGDWRVLYAIEDERVIVLILDVVRRDKAYR
ncbi:MAG: type II toxin-antitoxin system RelE/ParE family toxin [Anaerolineales bacterium]|nr:MAG: type II toxin-antitoxin system RelE/ParE family toxin [Anaerolineales bacterium]